MTRLKRGEPSIRGQRRCPYAARRDADVSNRFDRHYYIAYFRRRGSNLRFADKTILLFR